MFFFRRKVNKLIKFLDKADEAYLLAYEAKDTHEFSKYASKELVRRITQIVKSNPDISFGVKSRRKREWILIISEDTAKVYLRKIEQQCVKFSHYASMKLGDNVEEEWTISLGDKPIVIDIRR